MRCFIYKSLKKDGIYVYLSNKDDFSAMPKVLLDGIGAPEFVMEIELTPERKLARADSAQVIKQLEERGYFMQMPPVKFPVPEMLQ